MNYTDNGSDQGSISVIGIDSSLWKSEGAVAKGTATTSFKPSSPNQLDVILYADANDQQLFGGIEVPCGIPAINNGSTNGNNQMTQIFVCTGLNPATTYQVTATPNGGSESAVEVYQFAPTAATAMASDASGYSTYMCVAASPSSASLTTSKGWSSGVSNGKGDEVGLTGAATSCTATSTGGNLSVVIEGADSYSAGFHIIGHTGNLTRTDGRRPDILNNPGELAGADRHRLRQRLRYLPADSRAFRLHPHAACQL